MNGFPLSKLAPLPWRQFGNGTGVACADHDGSKIFATSAGHNFPKRGRAESIGLAKEIAHRVNTHETLIEALTEARVQVAILQDRLGIVDTGTGTLSIVDAALAVA